MIALLRNNTDYFILIHIITGCVQTNSNSYISVLFKKNESFAMGNGNSIQYAAHKYRKD